MNLKSFLIASLIIHIIGAIVLYFYYNPISLPPQPAEEKALNRVEGPEAAKAPQKKTKSQSAAKASRKKRRALKKQAAPEESSETFHQSGKAKKEFQKPESAEDIEFEEIELKPPEEAEALTAGALSTKPEADEAKAKSLRAPAPPEDYEEIEEEGEAAFKASKPEADGLNDKPEAEENREEYEEIEEDEAKKDSAFQMPQEAPANEKNTGFKPSKPDSAGLDKSSAPKPKESKKPLGEKEDYEEIEEENEAAFEPSKPEAPALSNRAESASEAKISKAAEEEKSAGGEDSRKYTKSRPRAFSSLKQKEGNPPLSYPEEARRSGRQGLVSILFFVDRRGFVEQIQLKESSGQAELDNFVLRRLARYQFLPDQEGWAHHTISFSLKGEEIERGRLRGAGREAQDF